MKIAATYIRVSTDDQLEYSPDSQLKAVRDYAKRNNMILPEEFIFREEDGISGKKADRRPEFQRMIGLAKTKPRPFDVIIVWKFSRFARNRQDSIVYKSMLRKGCGIDVVSVTEQLGDDKMGILIEAMIEAMDEYYSINLAEEVKRGMNEKVKRGEPVAAPAFGYSIQNKKYVVNPDTAPLVKMVFQDFISGMGYLDIAKKLNSMGVKTKRGGKWENRTVEYIIRNPVYLGKIRWNPEGCTCRNYDDPNIKIVDSDHEPIIDMGLWNTAQEKALRLKAMFGKYTRNQKEKNYMLRGLVKCSSCGKSLSQSGSNGIQCIGYAHGICQESHFITLPKINVMVLKTIEENFHSKRFQLECKTKHNNYNESAITEKQLQREYQKLVRVKEAYEAGIDTLEEYRENKKKITDQIESLKTKIPESIPMEELKAAFISSHVDVLKALADPTVAEDEKNRLLRSFVSKIIFNRKRCTVQIFYYL